MIAELARANAVTQMGKGMQSGWVPAAITTSDIQGAITPLQTVDAEDAVGAITPTPASPAAATATTTATTPQWLTHMLPTTAQTRLTEAPAGACAGGLPGQTGLQLQYVHPSRDFPTDDIVDEVDMDKLEMDETLSLPCWPIPMDASLEGPAAKEDTLAFHSRAWLPEEDMEGLLTDTGARDCLYGSEWHNRQWRVAVAAG